MYLLLFVFTDLRKCFESLKVFLQTGIPRVSFGNFIEDREQRSVVEASKYEDMLRYTNISEI